MKKALLLVLAAGVIMSSSLAYGQGGAIMLYIDTPTYTVCNVTTEPPPGTFLYVYAVHQFAAAKASRWKLQNTGIAGLYSWLLDQPAGFASGSGSQGGWAVSYGGCQGAGFLIATVWYQRSPTAGPAPACASIEVVADPTDATGQVTGSDCSDNLTYPDRSKLTFHADESCPCGIIVPVEQTSWGKLKALYE